eukprot:COSAG05_NODE_89_length_20177_cov_197.003586_5_plen_1527_part_00
MSCCAAPRQHSREERGRQGVPGRGCRPARGGAEPGRLHTDLRVTELRADHSAAALRGVVGGRSRLETGWSNNLPVVIVPGVCSSGLMVKKSTVCPSWEGERVWFSLAKLSQNIGRHSGHSSIPQGQSANKDALIVTVHRAILPQSAAKGSSSGHRLFAQLELVSSDGKQLPGTRKSRAVPESTLQPEWEQEIVLGSECELAEAVYLRVRVHDKDAAGKGTLAVVDIALDVEWQNTTEPTRFYNSQAFDMFNRRTYKTSSSRIRSGRALDTGVEFCGQVVLSLEFRPATHGPNSPAARRGSSRANIFAHEQDADERRSSSSTLGVAVEEARHMAGKALGIMEGAAEFAGNRMSHADYLAAAQLKQVDKSMWLRHVLLDTDSESDPAGIEVRNVEGLAGVDYLEASNRVLAATTWVFGKTIEYLKKRGYSEHNLKAVPYDWRLPPQILESRDKYFTRWVQLIETTSEDNGGKPVVLLGHSMGNKMCHYFLNWVVINAKTYDLMGGNGRAWLHRYVHSFFAVACPFLGSSAAFRTALTGRDIGLGAFLTHDESLTLNRNYGSTPWLMPTNALANSRPVSVVNMRKMCTVTIEIVRVKLLRNSSVHEGWVHVEYTNSNSKRRTTTRTKLVSPVDDDGRILEFDQKYQFVTPDSLREPSADAIKISLRGKSWLKDAKHAFQRRRLLASDRTRTSAGLFADNSSPVIGSLEITPSEIFGARANINVATAGEPYRARNMGREIQADQSEFTLRDLPSAEDISPHGIAVVIRLQAAFRGYRLRKLQWVASNWLEQQQMGDERTRFWTQQHRASAELLRWQATAQHLSIGDAAFALHEAGVIHNKIKDLQEYERVFSGHDAVEVLRKWLFEHDQSCKVEDAEHLCDLMLRAGYIRPAEEDSTMHGVYFDNDHTLYRFSGAMPREYTLCIGHKHRGRATAFAAAYSAGTAQSLAHTNRMKLQEALKLDAVLQTETLEQNLRDPPPLYSSPTKLPAQKKTRIYSGAILTEETGAGLAMKTKVISAEEHLRSSGNASNELRRRRLLKAQSQVAASQLVNETAVTSSVAPPPLSLSSKRAAVEPEPDSREPIRSSTPLEAHATDADLKFPVGVDESTIQVQKVLALSNGGDLIGEVFVRCMFEFGGSLTHDLGGGNLFERRDMKQTLRRFGASHVAEKWEARYMNDPCLPGGTTYAPPPCARVFHVYGTHLDTEVAYAYKRKDGCEVTLAGPKSASLELDTGLDKVFADPNYKCKGGIIFETKHTNQSTVLPSETRRQLRDTRRRAQVIASGDGTVPYMSLRHSITWNGRNGVKAQNVELRGVEHREILRSKAFHSVAGQYLCETLVVYVVRARNLLAMDRFPSSSDPFVTVKLHFDSGRSPVTCTTRVHKRTLNPTFEEAFVFGVDENLDQASFLSFEVADSDAGGMRVEHIGTVELSMQTLYDSPSRAVHGWFDLAHLPMHSKTGHDGKPHLGGELLLHCELENSGESFMGMGLEAAMRKISLHLEKREEEANNDLALRLSSGAKSEHGRRVANSVS